MLHFMQNEIKTCYILPSVNTKRSTAIVSYVQHATFRKPKQIGYIRWNFLLWQFIEGKIKGGIEVTGRWWICRRKLLDDLKERRGHSHMKEEALDRNIWGVGFRRGFGPVVRQTAKLMKIKRYITIFILCALRMRHPSSFRFSDIGFIL
jgi:hypothetical protein